MAVLVSVYVLFLNMWNILEISGLFVCLGGRVEFFSALGTEKLLGYSLLGRTSTQADPIDARVKFQ